LRTGLLCWVPDFSLDDYAYLFRLPTSINRMTCLIYRPTSSLICGWLAVVLLALAPFAISQVSSSTTQSREPQYTYHANVAEVAITFHASDAQGLPVNDLKHGEVTVFDNGVPQTMILSFQVFQDHAIRAGIIFDTSKSIENSLVQNRAIATLFAGKENPLGGTALFDTVFQACYSEFGKAGKASGKFILLFTDGEDNASHTDLKDVVDMCQQSNTAIYAFRPEAGLGFSDGPRTLLELTAKTGGCVFHADDSEPEIDKDLGIIEGNLRNQYLLSYHPLALKHDGSFHHIELRGPERVDKIGVRSGYYDRKDSPTELPQNGFIL
jgi:Ca-activated chloride channel family protein